MRIALAQINSTLGDFENNQTQILDFLNRAKEKELIALLERNGFVNRGGKGSHKNFVHPSGERLTILE